MGVVWLVLWIGLVAVALGALAWLVDRVGGGDQRRASRTEQQHLSEVEARAHSPYL